MEYTPVKSTKRVNALRSYGLRIASLHDNVKTATASASLGYTAKSTQMDSFHDKFEVEAYAQARGLLYWLMTIAPLPAKDTLTHHQALIQLATVLGWPTHEDEVLGVTMIGLKKDV